MRGGVSSEFMVGLSAAARRHEGVLEAIARQQQTPFWWQCVRDTTGSLDAYKALISRNNAPYFRGNQAVIDYTNEADRIYLEANARVRARIYRELPQVVNLDVALFRQWLTELRHELAYKKLISDAFPEPKRRRVPTHSPVVKRAVLAIAKTYGDPYVTGQTAGPVFPGFPAAALPVDKLEDGEVVHYYPAAEYADLYLSEALKTLRSVIGSSNPGGEECLRHTGYLLQLLANLHLFITINTSLYMNLVDALLEVSGRAGIKHGILDFVAMRLQPAAFFAYFRDQLDQ